MNTITPMAQAVLDALREAPATAVELHERLGRSRSSIDKALAQLTRTHQAVRADDPDGTSRWAVTTPTVAAEDTADGSRIPSPGDTEEGGDSGSAAEPSGEEPVPQRDPDADPPSEPPAEAVKICRGCQAQMSKVCPHCWQKTTTYCGACRKDNPGYRRTGSGEPQILTSGLPKLNRGELGRLVEAIMRAEPLPNHLGVTGWTPGRIAIFLPGRSTGAIANALDKLVATGTAELIGEEPKRYQIATAAGDEGDIQE